MLKLEDGLFPVFQSGFSSVVISDVVMAISFKFSVRELRRV